MDIVAMDVDMGGGSDMDAKHNRSRHDSTYHPVCGHFVVFLMGFFIEGNQNESLQAGAPMHGASSVGNTSTFAYLDAETTKMMAQSFADIDSLFDKSGVFKGRDGEQEEVGRLSGLQRHLRRFGRTEPLTPEEMASRIHESITSKHARKDHTKKSASFLANTSSYVTMFKDIQDSYRQQKGTSLT